MKKILIIFMSLVLAASCIKNDLSYPRIVADITSFAVEGQKSVEIDAGTRTVSVVLEETADITALPLLDFAYTPDAVILDSLPPVLDLSSPVTVTLQTYQDYVWTISAEQPISRYVTVKNQIGEADFKLDEKMVYVYVPEDQMLSSITIEDMKLEAEGSFIISTTGTLIENSSEVSVTEEVNLPMTLDCTLLRYFDVEYKDDTLRWALKVLPKQIDLEISSVNAWCHSADVKAVSKTGESPVVEYKASSASSWMQAEDLELSGRDVAVTLTRLKADTQYTVRIVDGELVSDEYVFKTEQALELHNMSFDEWYSEDPSSDKSAWFPDLDLNSNYIWDSANKGTAAPGYVPTTPERTDVAVSGPGKAAARLETMQVNILGIKKLAAGNIYTGKFGKVAGVGAELDWGVPFTSRPQALKGFYKYAPKSIDMAEAPYTDMTGKTDKCQIQVMLTDWEGPFRINTSEGRFVDVENDKGIIAFARFETDSATETYEEFVLELEYRDLTRIPKYVVISACASNLGDYFTGGVGSVLLVDEFEFIYR